MRVQMTDVRRGSECCDRGVGVEHEIRQLPDRCRQDRCEPDRGGRITDQHRRDRAAGGDGLSGDGREPGDAVRDVKVARGDVKGMPDMKALLALGEAAREQIGSGIAVLATTFEDGKAAMVVAVTDDVRARGAAADAIVKALAALAGGRGGGKPHMAQAGLPSVESITTVLAAVDGVVASLVTD
jgi:alanyl-tRNA synthetase